MNNSILAWILGVVYNYGKKTNMSDGSCKSLIFYNHWMMESIEQRSKIPNIREVVLWKREREFKYMIWFDWQEEFFFIFFFHVQRVPPAADRNKVGSNFLFCVFLFYNLKKNKFLNKSHYKFSNKSLK